jgi:hypothetical protein
MKLFDYVTSINDRKQDLMVDDTSENIYNSFTINRTFSYFKDTAVLANVMNQYHHLDNKLQYHFLLNIIRKKKRFSKWMKPDVDRDLEVVKEYYGYSNEKAKQVMGLLRKDQINVLRRKVYKGESIVIPCLGLE